MGQDNAEIEKAVAKVDDLVRRFQRRGRAGDYGIVLPVEGRAHLVQGLEQIDFPVVQEAVGKLDLRAVGCGKIKPGAGRKACGRRGQVDIDGLARRGEVEGLPSFRTLERRFVSFCFRRPRQEGKPLHHGEKMARKRGVPADLCHGSLPGFAQELFFGRVKPAFFVPHPRKHVVAPNQEAQYFLVNFRNIQFQGFSAGRVLAPPCCIAALFPKFHFIPRRKKIMNRGN